MLRQTTSSVPIFANGAISAAFVYMFNEGMDFLARRKSIVEAAMKHFASGKFAFGASYGHIGSGTNKCNIFVDAVLIDAGVGNASLNGGRMYRWFGIGEPTPVLAGQWADPNYDISGWEVVNGSYQAGDVLAYGYNGFGASGHVGVAVDNMLWIGASTNSVRIANYTKYENWGVLVGRRYVGF